MDGDTVRRDAQVHGELKTLRPGRSGNLGARRVGQMQMTNNSRTNGATSCCRFGVFINYTNISGSGKYVTFPRKKSCRSLPLVFTFIYLPSPHRAHAHTSSAGTRRHVVGPAPTDHCASKHANR